MQALARRLRLLRHQSGATQEQAARQVGITWRHLQRIEGAETNVTLRTLLGLANAYGVELNDLFVAD